MSPAAVGTYVDPNLFLPINTAPKQRQRVVPWFVKVYQVVLLCCYIAAFAAVVVGLA